MQALVWAHLSQQQLDELRTAAKAGAPAGASGSHNVLRQHPCVSGPAGGDASRESILLDLYYSTLQQGQVRVTGMGWWHRHQLACGAARARAAVRVSLAEHMPCHASSGPAPQAAGVPCCRFLNPGPENSRMPFVCRHGR